MVLLVLLALLNSCLAAFVDQTTLTTLSQAISFDLVDFGDRILGTHEMEAHLKTLATPTLIIDGNNTLNTIASRLTMFLSERAQMTLEVQASVLSSYAHTLVANPPAAVTECCVSNPMQFNEVFGRMVDLEYTCNRYPAGFVASENLEDIRVANEIQPSLVAMRNRHETALSYYYASAESGLHTRNPRERTSVSCNNYDPRFRPWYVESTTVPKMVILVIDCSGSMANEQRMVTAKTAARTVLETLNPLDYVQVIKFESFATTYRPMEVLCEDVALPATSQNIKLLTAFVDSFTASGGTNFASALTAAYRVIMTSRTANVSQTIPTTILFMTDGEATPFYPEEPEVNPPIIFSFAFGSGVGQTYLDYLLLLATNTNGRFLQIPDGNANQLRTAMGSYYLHPQFANDNRNNVTMSLPYVTTSQGLAMTMTLPVYYNSVFRGVVGVDVGLHEIYETVRSAFDAELFSHVFVCDDRGRALIHPNLPSPQLVFDDAISIDIAVLEGSNSEFRTLFEQSLESGEPGSLYVTGVNRSLSRGQGNEGTGVAIVNGTYFWKSVSVPSTALHLFVGVFLVDAEFRLKQRIHPSLLPSPLIDQDFSLFHRFDLMPNGSVETQREPGTGVLLATQRSAVFFASTLYVRANRFLFGPEQTNEDVNKIHWYLNQAAAGSPDPNDILTFQAQVDARATQKAEEIWKNPLLLLGDTSPDQILSRYIGTLEGTFRKFPGSKMGRSYHPVTRPWFQRALRNPDKFTISQPYAAASGSGTVLTLSKVVSLSNHTGAATANAVMGMNFLVPKFDSLIRTRIQSLLTQTGVVLIVDSSGYILFSSAVTNAKSSPFLGTSHPNVAKALFDQGLLVRSMCNNLNASNVESSFELMGMDLPPQILYSCGTIGYAHIPQTNTFLVMFEPYNCFRSSCPVTTTNVCNVEYCPCYRAMTYSNCKGEYEMAPNPACVLPVVDPSSLVTSAMTSSPSSILTVPPPTKSPRSNGSSESNDKTGAIIGAVLGFLVLFAFYFRAYCCCSQTSKPERESKSIPVACVVKESEV